MDKEILKATERGLRRILHSLNMLPDYTQDEPRGTRELRALGSVFSHDAGLFEPFKDIADAVEEGEVVGHVHSPEKPWKALEVITSPYGGIVLCKRAVGQVRCGDAVFQIAEDLVTQ